MALAQSSLSRACRSVADLLTAGLSTGGDTVQVLVGTPAAAEALPGDAKHRLNLFFYGLRPSGFQSDSAPSDTWRLRLQCLITPFGIDEGGISAGENDLRILGEVIRLLHEQPILPEVGVDGESVRLRAVFEPLDLDGLNRLWTTQNDVSLRPSVTYEIALVPAVPSRRAVQSPLVGSLGVGIGPDTDGTGVVQVDRRAPDVRVTTVDVRHSDWTPHVCFVDSGECSYTLAFEVGRPALAGFSPRVWIAGLPGADVRLDWEQWDAHSGWTTGPSSAAAASGDTIDPSGAAGATLTTTALPWSDRPGQFTLSAARQSERGNGTPVTLRSNPLLVTLYADDGA
jgi:hypothetical protein